MGNLTYGIVFQMIGTYIVFYATVVLGIPGTIVGAAVSISILWDALSDPLMGYLSDLTKSKRFGRRHLYILLGTFLMALFNYLIWSINPDWSIATKSVLVFLCLLAVRTSMTVFLTPYTALGAELSSDYDERTSIQGVRMIFFISGLMAATVMGFFIFFNPTPEFPVGQTNPDAYINMGITTSIIAFVFGLTCFLKTFKYIPSLQIVRNGKTQTGNLRNLVENFKSAFNNRDYRCVVFGYLLGNIATALISSLGIHVFTYTFNLEAARMGIVFGIIFIASIASQPLWVKISALLDKKPTVLTGIGITIIGCLMFLGLVIANETVDDNIIYFIPFAAITGFGMGALFSLPFSMIADTIDFDEYNTGVRMEGVYYGAMTFFYKLSQSIAIFIIGIMLDIINFDPDAAIQPRSTVMSLGVTLALGSFIVLVLAGISYYKYSLNKGKVTLIQNKIVRRDTAGNTIRK